MLSPAARVASNALDHLYCKRVYVPGARKINALGIRGSQYERLIAERL
jgi:hypothetical protein